MTKLSGYSPNIAIPPGETIANYLYSLGMTQAELSIRLGISEKHLSQIINGKAPITAETALKLECVFGTPASFWNNLEANYRDTLARLEEKQKIIEEVEIAREIPYHEISKLGFVFATRDTIERVINLRKFFGVSSLKAVPDVLPAAFRKAENKKTSAVSLAAWLRMGELVASKIETKPFNIYNLKEIVPEIRRLTQIENPKEFLPRLNALLASCGVALVLIPHLPNTYVCGLSKWLTKDKVLIQLSNRGSCADIFWFTLFHELGHIMKQHSKKETFINYTESREMNKLEEEANRYASETLIPRKQYEEFLSQRTLNANSIIEFAKFNEVHPCIVVGRLQHDKHLNYNQLNSLKPRFKWT